jgi:hypothetical protein
MSTTSSNDRVSQRLRCGACLRLLSEPGASVMHMRGEGNRVICGEKAVQVWAVISVEDARELLGERETDD